MQAPGVTWGDTKRRRVSAAIVAATVVGLAGQVGLSATGASATGVRATGVSTTAGSTEPTISLLGDAYSPVYDAASPQMLASATGANKYWSSGFFGQGIGVAVLDSGVSKVDGLRRNVFYGPDLSPEGRDVNLANLDTFGHGTFMSGLIAGRTDAATRPYLADYSATSYVGTAPEAKIISVKVADSLGNTQQSTIIRGIDWVIQHRNDPGLNIRVLNLSLGAVNSTGYLNDALSAATERAWAAGIVVVAAAGNDGSAGLLLPAADPYVIAVGAIDNINTVSVADDKLADFSNRGSVGIRTPEFSAPGTHVIGLRVPGSYIDTTFSGTGAASPSFFRGSGTSEAAAITSGAAALVLSQYPSATPDQVKALLTGHAMLLPGLNSIEAGRGGLYVAGAFGEALTSVRQAFIHSANWQTVSANWAGGSWSNNVWTGPGAPAPTVSESGSRWTGSRWTGAAWTGSRWTGSTWSGSRWTEYSWR
jgi:serine protease AprX